MTQRYQSLAVLAALVAAALFLLAALAPATALASTGETTAPGLLYELLDVAIQVLAVALMTLVGVIARRYGLGVDAKRLADQAIGYAEERARKAAKNADGAIDGKWKLGIAAEFFRSYGSKRLVAFLGGQVEDYIEARLGDRRLTGDA